MDRRTVPGLIAALVALLYDSSNEKSVNEAVMRRDDVL